MTTFEVPADSRPAFIRYLAEHREYCMQDSVSADTSPVDQHESRREAERDALWIKQMQAGQPIEVTSADEVRMTLVGDGASGAIPEAETAGRWRDVGALAGVMVALDAA